MEKNKAIKTIGEYQWGLTYAVNDLVLDEIARVANVLSKARDEGKRVYIVGNGGSASTASHFTSDLNKGAISKGKTRFKAFCLSDNIPIMTAWANDTHYGMIFAEQLENFVEAGDVVIAISGSGNSPNIINTVRLAKSKKAFTVGMTGFDGGLLKGLVDLAVVVPSDNMEIIEDVHLMACHMIKTCLRDID